MTSFSNFKVCHSNHFDLVRFIKKEKFFSKKTNILILKLLLAQGLYYFFDRGRSLSKNGDVRVCPHGPAGTNQAVFHSLETSVWDTVTRHPYYAQHLVQTCDLDHVQRADNLHHETVAVTWRHRTRVRSNTQQNLRSARVWRVERRALELFAPTLPDCTSVCLPSWPCLVCKSSTFGFI